MRMSSPPVTSVVSPKMSVAPASASRSNARPTVGFDARPEVVSDSPHLVLIVNWLTGNGSRRISEASCTNSLALRDAASIVFRSPERSMLNPAHGFPVFAISLTMRSVQFGSMPMTIAAAQFGLRPCPASVRNVSSRSAPNCSLP